MSKRPLSREFKDASYAQLARIGKALSSGPRLELLDLLGQGPKTVEVLAGQTGLSVANTSRHLQVLRREHLVESSKEGVRVRYRLAADEVAGFFRSFRRLAERQLHEVRAITHDFLEARDALDGVDCDALVQRVRDGEVTVLDVRPADEYAAGHIPGALSVPLDTLDGRLREVPRDRDVVAYCRGPYCVMALEAVETLRAAGFEAARLDEGVVDWRARGLPLQTAGDPS